MDASRCAFVFSFLKKNNLYDRKLEEKDFVRPKVQKSIEDMKNIRDEEDEKEKQEDKEFMEDVKEEL